MASRADIEPVGVVLSRSRGLCGRSWAALGAYVAGPGLLLEPQRAVLGCSWNLLGLSWHALKASVGGLGPSSVALGPWPAGPGLQSGPFSSGNVIWEGIKVEKGPVRAGDVDRLFSDAGNPYAFFH